MPFVHRAAAADGGAGEATFLARASMTRRPSSVEETAKAAGVEPWLDLMAIDAGGEHVYVRLHGGAALHDSWPPGTLLLLHRVRVLRERGCPMGLSALC